MLDEIEDDLDISKDKNAKNIDNIINKKTISKTEKSDNNSDDNDDKIKPKFKEYKIDHNELNQSVIGKNAITFLEKKQQKIAWEYLSKFAGNDNLYIHPNIYEGSNPSFLLLNLPEDQEGFTKFFRGYYLEKKRLGQISTTGVNQKNSLYQSDYII
jgi:hypothetical protein